MSLPPIVTNSPLYRLLTREAGHREDKAGAGENGSTTPGDTVNISPAALQELEKSKNAIIDTPDKARATAVTIRDALAADPDLALGPVN